MENIKKSGANCNAHLLHFKLIVIGLILFFNLNNVFSGINGSLSNLVSQAGDEVEAEKNNSYKISILGGNSIEQNGKKMSKSEYYLKPAFYYEHSSGFYSALSCIYMPTDKKEPLDNISFNIGYDKDFGDYLTLGIDYTYSYYFTTKQVASGVPHTFMLSGSWYNRIVIPAFYVIYNYGTTKDYTLSFDFTHVFSFPEIFSANDKLSIALITGLYAGTTNFYEDYTTKNKLGSKNVTSTVSSKFSLTSAFINSSVKYKISFVSFGAGINYSLPLNQQKVLNSNNLPTFTVNTSFYF